VAAWKDPKAMIVHSSSTLETRRAAYGTSVVTPTNRLFVRNNLPASMPPSWSNVMPGRWRLRALASSLLTLADLKTLGVETVATVLQCSGNGRGFFPSKPSGTPWQGRRRLRAVEWRATAYGDPCAGRCGRRHGLLTGTGGEKLPEGVTR
jgi:sulfite dehydrogenase